MRRVCRRRVHPVDLRMGADLAVPLRVHLLGAEFSNAGECGDVHRGLPHLWLAGVGITISVLPVLAFTTILFVANFI